MFLNVTAIDANFIMQTLGVIIQAYAFLLALADASYVFLIERINTQYEEVEDHLYSLLRRLEEHYPFWDFSFIEIIEYGVDHFLENDRIDDTTKSIVTRNVPWDDVVHYQNKYEALKRKRGVWTYKHFSTFFLFCILILIFSISNMYVLGIGYVDPFASNLSFSIIVLLSVSGFLYFMKKCWDLV